MYVGFIKLYEDEDKVIYRIHTDIMESYPTKRREIILWKTVYAYCTFYKSTAEMELDHKKSNVIFMSNQLKREKIHTYVLLKKIKQNNEEFPLSTCINTGG